MRTQLKSCNIELVTIIPASTVHVNIATMQGMLTTPSTPHSPQPLTRSLAPPPHAVELPSPALVSPI